MDLVGCGVATTLNYQKITAERRISRQHTENKYTPLLAKRQDNILRGLDKKV